MLISRYNSFGTFLLIILFSSGNIFAHEGHEEKIKLYTEMIEADPNNPENYLFRGIQYQSHNYFPEARTDFNKVLALKPDHALVNYQFAYLYLNNDRSDSALIHINRYIELIPDHAKGYLCRADVYNKKSLYEMAAKDYEMAIDLSNPPGIELFFALSNNYKDAGELVKAKQVLDEAVRDIGNLIPIREAAISLSLELGSFEEAHKIIDGIIYEINRKEVWYVMKAEIYEAENKTDEAIKHYNLALQEINKLNRNYRNKDSIKELENKIINQLNNFD